MPFLTFRMPYDEEAWRIVEHLKLAASRLGFTVEPLPIEGTEKAVELHHPTQGSLEMWEQMISLRSLESLRYPNPDGF